MTAVSGGVGATVEPGQVEPGPVEPAQVESGQVELAQVQQARARIGGRVRRTPVLDAGAPGGAPAGGDGREGRDGSTLWFKLEYLQHTGSFKPRGMFNRILAARESGELGEAGVVTASGGNAGLAVAYAAAQLGVAAEVFVPETAPATKVDRLLRSGARVVQRGSAYAEAYEAAVERQAETGAVFCHAYDQPEVVAGQGTVALELLEQVPGVETILVAVGGGGLMGGIAAGAAGRARIVAVEPEGAPTLHAALAAGAPVEVQVGGVAADSLGARRIGDVALEVARRRRVDSVLVPDDAIMAARRELWEEYRIVVEPGAATAYAALRSGAYRPSPGERVAVVLCGGNTDPADLSTS